MLYYAVWHWNEWFYASIYLQDRELYPLQLFLRELLIAKEVKTMQDGTADMLMMDRYKDLMDYCTIIVATVPILLIYPLLQKHFVKGVMIGSVKG